MGNWYAVQTKGRQEAVAKEHLQRQGFHAYLPLIAAAKRRRGRLQAIVEPLFPSYLFVEIDVRAQNTAPIRSTRGVIGLVRFGGEITPVPPAIIEGLRRSHADPDAPIDLSNVLKPGDAIAIVAGPLAGLQAVFEAPSGEQRVCLLLDLLGRRHHVVLDAAAVAPALPMSA